MTDLADSAMRVARRLYYYDVRSASPENVVVFDDIPLRSQIRYFEQAAEVLEELGVIGIG